MPESVFYLASTEGYGLEEPRRCTSLRRLRTPNRDDLLLVAIDPPIIGQPYGLGGDDLMEVIVAARYQEESLFPKPRFPVHVHVARPLVDLSGRDLLLDDEFEVIAWGELYATERAARVKAV